MIFVTVGTHEQPFDRLIHYMDNLQKYMTKEEVVIQTGFSTYKPEFCKWSHFYSYQNMVDYVKSARIVITHGGPSSFIMALQEGKVPIVVPRQKHFYEHVNDHQVIFTKMIAEREKNIIIVENIEELGKKISDYENIISSMNTELKSNNAKFNIEFEKLVCKILKPERNK